MAISQKLHTKLVQKLILTPSLQQAIKLLPMSTLELSELLNQEMVENPMLEEVPTEELQPVEATQEKQEDKGATEKEKGDTWDDQDYEYFFGDYLDDGYRSRAPQEVKELPPIENTLSTGQSLTDHLIWQLSMQTDDPTVRAILLSGRGRHFTAAAQVLDVQRTYLHQKVKVLGIRRPGAEGEEEVAEAGFAYGPVFQGLRQASPSLLLLPSRCELLVTVGQLSQKSPKQSLSASCCGASTYGQSSQASPTRSGASW